MVLTIEMFKTDKITAISVDDKNSGEFNYKSVKFAYDEGEVPPIRIDGDLDCLDLETRIVTPIRYR